MESPRFRALINVLLFARINDAWPHRFLQISSRMMDARMFRFSLNMSTLILIVKFPCDDRDNFFLDRKKNSGKSGVPFFNFPDINKRG